MKKTLNILIAIIVSLSLFSCFFEDDTTKGKTDISKIELKSEFKELTFLAMDNPDFGVEIKQIGDTRELHYEWSYGKRNGNSDSYPISDESTIISNDSLLTFQFPYLGEYTLKLMVDNGEDVKCEYFKLTVSAGYDEGLAVLTEDEFGKGHMSFLKTLTEQDVSNGVEEQVISDFYSDLEINHPKDITSPNNKAIYITDGEGKILVFNQQTMALDMICRQPILNGAYISDFSSYFYSSAGGRLGCYCFTSDKKVYRFDSSVGELGTLITSDKYVKFDYKDIDAEYALDTDYRYAFYINYTKSTITGIYGSYGYFNDYSENYSLLSVGFPYCESSSYIYIVAKLVSDPTKYVVVKESKSLNRIRGIKTYDLPSELTIGKDTKFINSDEYDDFLCYIYKNKIYRWDFKSTEVPQVDDYVRFDIPDGEEITDICFNGDREGTKMFVCTYNSSRTTKYKGSIYVYHPDTFERINAFEGVTNRAVDMIYKKL